MYTIYIYRIYIIGIVVDIMQLLLLLDNNNKTLNIITAVKVAITWYLLLIINYSFIFSIQILVLSWRILQYLVDYARIVFCAFGFSQFKYSDGPFSSHSNV